jgi:hypothetical protein
MKLVLRLAEAEGRRQTRFWPALLAPAAITITLLLVFQRLPDSSVVAREVLEANCVTGIGG